MLKGMLVKKGIDILGKSAEKVLRRDDVPLPMQDVKETTQKLETEIKADLDEEKIAVVPVQSAWKSKTNWLAIPMAIGGMLLTVDPNEFFNVLDVFGLNLPAEVRMRIITGIGSISFVVVWYFKTFHTKTITPSSNK